MKAGLRLLVVGSMALYLAAVLAGCKVRETQPGSSVLVAIAIEPSAPSLAPGTTLQLKARGVYSNNVVQNLTNQVVWESADPGVATVNSAGLAAATASTGSTTITATLNGITGTAVLTSSPLVSLAVTPTNHTIAAGTNLQFTAVGLLLNGATQDLTSFVLWSSSNGGAAAISASGLAMTTASSGGTTTITATMSAVSGPASLTVSAVLSLAVTPAEAAIALGQSQQFTATAALTGSATQDLTTAATWTTSNPTVATVSNTAGSNGLVVSKSVGTTSVSASYGGVTSNAALVTVDPAVIVSVSITPVNPTVALGLQQQFAATGTYSDGTTADITASATWTSSNAQVATIAGTAGLASTLSTGTTNITASFGGIVSNKATLVVTPAQLATITVTPSNPTILFGMTEQFTATGTFTDGSTQVMTTAVTWSSSNTSVAFISNASGAQGLAFTAAAGTTTITATSGSVAGDTVLTVTFF